jgi:hypothetical protein
MVKVFVSNNKEQVKVSLTITCRPDREGSDTAVQPVWYPVHYQPADAGGARQLWTKAGCCPLVTKFEFWRENLLL